MNWNRINIQLTLIANLAVLIGLVVLVYEVRQNTQALRNETDVAIYSLGAEQANVLIDNPEVARIWSLATANNLESLTPVDRLRLSIIYAGIVDRLELQYRLYSRNEVTLDRNSIVFPEVVLSVPAFRDWWDQQKNLYHPEFVSYFEGILRGSSE